jgi:hypothetical protein
MRRTTLTTTTTTTMTSSVVLTMRHSVLFLTPWETIDKEAFGVVVLVLLYYSSSGKKQTDETAGKTAEVFHPRPLTLHTDSQGISNLETELKLSESRDVTHCLSFAQIDQLSAIVQHNSSENSRRRRR